MYLHLSILYEENSVLFLKKESEWKETCYLQVAARNLERIFTIGKTGLKSHIHRSRTRGFILNLSKRRFQSRAPDVHSSRLFLSYLYLHRRRPSPSRRRQIRGDFPEFGLCGFAASHIEVEHATVRHSACSSRNQHRIRQIRYFTFFLSSRYVRSSAARVRVKSLKEFSLIVSVLLSSTERIFSRWRRWNFPSIEVPLI